MDGIAVGGMGRTQAAELLRGKIEEELKEKKLEIIAPNKEPVGKLFIICRLLVSMRSVIGFYTAKPPIFKA